jgi:hypothetical protein
MLLVTRADSNYDLAALINAGAPQTRYAAVTYLTD